VKISNPLRTCPECGAAFTATHGRQTFCTTAHKQAFHNLMMTRGKALMPLALVWRSKRKPSTPDSRYAFQELCKLLDIHNAEDRAAGRRVDIIVAHKRAANWAAVDLTSQSSFRL
jgi:ribosomal protein S27AE